MNIMPLGMLRFVKVLQPSMALSMDPVKASGIAKVRKELRPAKA